MKGSKATSWLGLGFAALLVLILASLWAVVFRVDLSPQVESDFFFSSEDRAFRETQEIAETFPASEQLLLNVSGPGRADPEYLDRIRKLTAELASDPGVSAVQSLTSGPPSPAKAEKSPLWSRLLLSEDRHSSQLIVSVVESPDARFIERIEEILARHQTATFSIKISGVPYVVELIRRHLLRDLRVFSIAAIAVFGLTILLVYRSWPLVLGTLLSCVGACLLTLTVLHLMGTPIGILTANIATIVFVLTLSHTVFLTSNWRRFREVCEPQEAVARGVRTTLAASFWCMITALMGFGSLLLASAKPLRELGISGVTGTLIAISVAYLFYPFFLRFGRPPESVARLGRPALAIPGVGITALVLILCSGATFGLRHLDTDPSLLSYFSKSSEIRSGLEWIDRLGGSSPLKIVVADPDGEPLDTLEAAKTLTAVQAAIEEEPAVGVALSLAVLLDEAHQNPFARLLPPSTIIKLLDTDPYHHISRSFIDEDHRQALFFMRMRESGRDESRQSIIDRLRSLVEREGLEVKLVGGLYDLQSKMGRLVASSLGRELGGLLFFFVFVAATVSRSARVTLVMVACLAAVPLLLLGAEGLLGQPVDLISAPGTNVAIALGIDAMIHLVMALRRRLRAGETPVTAWRQAIAQQRPAIVGAMSIVAAGFAIFALSSFPATRRFGLLVASGSLVSALMALKVLPFLGAWRVTEAALAGENEKAGSVPCHEIAIATKPPVNAKRRACPDLLNI